MSTIFIQALAKALELTVSSTKLCNLQRCVRFYGRGFMLATRVTPYHSPVKQAHHASEQRGNGRQVNCQFCVMESAIKQIKKIAMRRLEVRHEHHRLATSNMLRFALLTT